MLLFHTHVYTQIMQQTVKAIHVIAIVFIVTCVSSFFHYPGRHLSLIGDYTCNSENTSTKFSLTYGSSQVYLVQDGHVSRDASRKPFTSNVGETAQLKDGYDGTTFIQAQHSPDLINITSAPTEVHILHIKSQKVTVKRYILPYSIYEEQTNGANNLWQLQLWAKQVGMHVVEPFTKDSIFAMKTIIPNFSQAL